MNSRTKGKRGELELSHELTGLFGTDCRRSQQFCGGAGDADVVGLPGLHVEVKRVERLVIDNAMKQAVEDAKGGNVPSVWHRRNRGDWMVTVRLSDLQEFAKRVAAMAEGDTK